MREMNDKLKTTLRAWPLIAAATIGMCFATQGAAKLFGIDLPDQQQVEAVRYVFMHAFDSAKDLNIMIATLLQVLLIMPVLEELLFRWLLVMMPTRRFVLTSRTAYVPVVAFSSALFSFAHYIDYVSLAKGHGFALTGWNAAFIALFFFGMAQCWLYRKTDRVWCPMLNHALFNLTNVVLLFVVPAST